MPLKYRTLPNWRDQYNPLRGLTLNRIIAMEDQAERGEWADLQFYWHHMEGVDSIVRSAVAKRLSYVNALDWEIRQIETEDPNLAAEQAEVLRYAYDRIDNLKEAATRAAYAVFTGYSIFEKERGGYGPFIKKLHYIEPWFWIRDKEHAIWRFNPEAKPGSLGGEIVDNRDLVIVDFGDPIYRSIGRTFFAKQLSLADWDQALENGANQSVFVVGPPGATDEEEAEYQALAEAITSNLRGYLPNGADVKLTDPGSRNRMPYYDRIKYSDEQIVLAATGGILTMLTEAGSGTLAGGAHENSLLALARADAAKVSELFQQQIDKEVLREFFPKQPTAAYFHFDVPKATESLSDIVELVSNLSWAGYRVEMKQLEEKLGLKLEMIPQGEMP